jgi:hypothetical protein
VECGDGGRSAGGSARSRRMWGHTSSVRVGG